MRETTSRMIVISSSIGQFFFRPIILHIHFRIFNSFCMHVTLKQKITTRHIDWVVPFVSRLPDYRLLSRDWESRPCVRCLTTPPEKKGSISLIDFAKKKVFLCGWGVTYASTYVSHFISSRSWTLTKEEKRSCFDLGDSAVEILNKGSSKAAMAFSPPIPKSRKVSLSCLSTRLL